MSSLRTKIFVQYISLVIGSFILIGFIMNYFLENYFFNQLKTQLNSTAETVISSLTAAQKNYSDSDILNIYNEILNFYSITSNSHIIVFDRNGNIKAYSNSTKKYFANGSIPSSLVSKILKGESISEISNFNNFFGVPSVVVGKPLIIENSAVGGVFCTTPMPFIRGLKWDIFRRIFSAMFIALILAILLALILSREISKPLKQINDAVKSISKGNFDNRLDTNFKGDMHQLAIDFNEMATSLENLEQMRKNFISNVSHELRTPMTIITGFLEGILDGTIPHEKHNEYIHLVISETKRLTRLVNDLLDVAKIESGGSKLTYDSFDINELIRISLIKFENRILEKDLDVRLFLDGDVLMAYANLDSIERVVTNLIDNAVKFVNATGYICLKTSVIGDTINVSVENSGVGIKDEDIDHIWERFHKSDKSRSIDKTGVGLGLYIVKSIINQHNQHINVTSVPYKYTRFTFTLQLSK